MSNTDKLTSRQRFIRACACQPVDRPPVWLMRQAGRALPEYRKLKETYTFLQLVQNPEMAAEVTLQPVRRFGFDAAILFSDILTIPEAMGQPYHFRETGGIGMDFAVRSAGDVEKLSVTRVTEKLDYVDKALRILRRELGDATALIGFAGSPWTLATFMMEGGSAGNYTRALALFQDDRETFDALLGKLTKAVTAYLQMQIAAGVDAVQIFDSHGGHLSSQDFQQASGQWMKQIISALNNGKLDSHRRDDGGNRDSRPDKVPVIAFSLGTHGNWADLTAMGSNVIGIDWQSSLAEVRKVIPDTIALQGNLSPALLADGTPEVVAAETMTLLEAMRGRHGHIFNLGHGLTPGAKLENIGALVETVKKHR